MRFFRGRGGEARGFDLPGAGALGDGGVSRLVQTPLPHLILRAGGACAANALALDESVS